MEIKLPTSPLRFQLCEVQTRSKLNRFPSFQVQIDPLLCYKKLFAFDFCFKNIIEKIGHDLGVIGHSRIEDREKDTWPDIEQPPPSFFSCHRQRFGGKNIVGFDEG